MNEQVKLNIPNARYASLFIKEFYNQYTGREFITKTSHVNLNGSHIDLIDSKTGQVFHIKFSTENFHKFGEFYTGYSEEEGESIDKSVVDRLRDTDVIFFAQPDIIRKCLVEDMKKFGFIRQNIADNKTQTYSISISKLEVFA